MEISKEKIRLLGLSNKETCTLEALINGVNTPLLISRLAKISRPAVYDILEKLKNRGIVEINLKNGKKYWSIKKSRKIAEELFNTKKELLKIDEGVNEIQDKGDSTVIVHRGKEAVKNVIFDIIEKHKEERLLTIQGDGVVSGWNKTIGVDTTNKINRLTKKNSIITEIIFPQNLFERQVKEMGRKWLEDFEGRPAVFHEIDKKYFDHAGQIWIFKKSLYLIDMEGETIIEIRKSEILKLIVSMYRFIQNNSKKIDLNSRLRQLIEKEQ